MSTASSTNFTVSTRRVIERALRMVNGLRSGDSASAAQMADCKVVLNSIVGELDLRRLGLWTLKEATFTTTAGLSSYTQAQGLPTDILRLEGAIYVNSTSDELPLTILGPTEFDKINDKTLMGIPEAIYLSDEEDLSTRTAKLWVVPDSAKTVRLRYRRPNFYFDADSDSPDVPGYFFSLLSYQLASEIAEEYTNDNEKISRLQNTTLLKMKELKAANTKNTSNSRSKDHQYY